MVASTDLLHDIKHSVIKNIASSEFRNLNWHALKLWRRETEHRSISPLAHPKLPDRRLNDREVIPVLR